LKKRTLKSLLIALLLIIAYAVLIEPYWIRVKTVAVTDVAFSGFFKTYKTILISDLHVSRLGIREKLLLRKIRKISPDIIFMTGDFVSWGGNYEKTLAFMRKLKARVGTWAVLGDSDYQNTRKVCIFCHAARFQKKSIPAKFLRDQTVYLHFGHSKVALSGIELFQKDTRKNRALLAKDDSYPRIILSHRQFNPERVAGKSVLVLSGDTHGGQVIMPRFLWKKLFGESKGEISSGMVSDGHKSLFVTRGVGTDAFPLRFLCPPEIVLFVAD
jgi:predicted MPP superfamily phosphohydrolase